MRERGLDLRLARRPLITGGVLAVVSTLGGCGNVAGNPQPPKALVADTLPLNLAPLLDPSLQHGHPDAEALARLIVERRRQTAYQIGQRVLTGVEHPHSLADGFTPLPTQSAYMALAGALSQVGYGVVDASPHAAPSGTSWTTSATFIPVAGNQPLQLSGVTSTIQAGLAPEGLDQVGGAHIQLLRSDTSHGQTYWDLDTSRGSDPHVHVPGWPADGSYPTRPIIDIGVLRDVNALDEHVLGLMTAGQPELS